MGEDRIENIITNIMLYSSVLSYMTCYLEYELIRSLMLKQQLNLHIHAYDTHDFAASVTFVRMKRFFYILNQNKSDVCPFSVVRIHNRIKTEDHRLTRSNRQRHGFQASDRLISLRIRVKYTTKSPTHIPSGV